jgi:hypothetical protein
LQVDAAPFERRFSLRKQTMKIIVLAAGAAAVALSSGLAFAQTPAPPKQPIPYSQLNAYVKASPKMRASKDWWAGQSDASAAAGAAANTSATTTAGSDVRSAPDAASGASSSSTAVNPPSAPSTPPVDAPTPGAVNPSPTATPGAPPPATPPK